MTNQTSSNVNSQDVLPNHGKNDVDVDTYDRGIVPAETAARKEREGEHFKETPATAGYTVDKEGLLNNYAIEPEMYINEPGDLREEEEALHAQREKELQEVNTHDQDGNLTGDHDNRGHGPGVI